MNKGLKILCLSMVLGFVVLSTGCTTMVAKVSATGVPLAELQTTATYDVIGSAKGSATGATLFGFIPIGGGSVKKIGMIATGMPYQRPPLPIEDEAIYNAIESVKGADAIIAPRWHIKVNNYVIYQEKTVTVQAKAIRYNPSVK